MNAISRFFNMRKSLDSLYLLSKDNKEYNELFLEKMYIEHPKLDNLLRKDYYGFQDYIENNFKSYMDSSNLKHYMQLEKDRITIKHLEVLLNKNELKEQISNSFLSKYGMNIMPFIKDQRDYCLYKFDKNPEKYIKHLSKMRNQCSYFESAEFYNVELLLKLKEYGGEVSNMKNDHEIQTRILSLYTFNDIITEFYYFLYEFVKYPETNISERTSWDILKYSKDPSFKLFDACIKNIEISGRKDTEKLFEILKDSQHKAHYTDLIKAMAGELNEAYNKDLENLVTSLKVYSLAKSTSRRSSNRNSYSNDGDWIDTAVDIGVDVAVGAAIGAGIESMFD